ASYFDFKNLSCVANDFSKTNQIFIRGYLYILSAKIIFGTTKAIISMFLEKFIMPKNFLLNSAYLFF
ncbi:hypothetical protein, partial [Campylobacter concisus]|uniref:hypothetical protein n=1 Tax=Campylobacter concisus TaxID=199 RepID=UPI001CA31888